MPFYKPSNQRKLRKFFKKHNFVIEEGGNHCKATHSPTGTVIIFPRHNTVSSGVTKQICSKLVELGYDRGEVERSLL